MYDLMMNDEPLVVEKPFEYADQSDMDMGDDIDLEKISIDTEMYFNQTYSFTPKKGSLADPEPFISNKTKELLTEEYLALSSIKEKA